MAMWKFVLYVCSGFALYAGVGCGVVRPDPDFIDTESIDPALCDVELVVVDEWWIPTRAGSYFRDDWSVMRNRTTAPLRAETVIIFSVRSTDPSVRIEFDSPVTSTRLSIPPAAVVGKVGEDVPIDIEPTIVTPLLSFDIDFPGTTFPEPFTIEMTMFVENVRIQPQIRFTPDSQVDSATPVDSRGVCSTPFRFFPEF